MIKIFVLKNYWSFIQFNVILNCSETIKIFTLLVKVIFLNLMFEHERVFNKSIIGKITQFINLINRTII